MMEDKKLNFNQPLLSVRRYAPPKVERKKDDSRPVIPRLPPHRSELKSGPIKNPGAVPFLWEQTPGQPKEDIKPQAQKSNRQPPITPKLPPGRYCHKNDENVENFENRKETTEEKKSSSDSGDSSSDDGEYVDALDTLSRVESSFLNCSMTGLSGLDDLHVETSRSFFSTDREFMMDRFLPAAKAMAIETPQYAPPKKQSLVEERPQPIKKVVSQYKPSLRYGPSFAKQYSHYHGNDDGEELSDDEYDGHESLPGVCGLLPRFCLKSSLCLLNPIPATSVRTRARMVSSGNKGQARSSLAGSYSETENESRSDKTELKSIDKIHTAELDQDKTRLRSESSQLGSHSTSTNRDAPLPFLEEKEVLAIPEEKTHAGVTTFLELLANQGSPKDLDSGGPVIEKTLYIDTLHNVEPPIFRPFSPNKQKTKDGEIFTKDMDRMHAISSSVEDFKKLNTLDGEEKLLPKAHKFGDFNILSSTDKSSEKCTMGMENQDFKLQVTENEAKESLEKELWQLPNPPPLPKSPSDSWLWRTLPSMSTKNASLRSYPHAATKGSSNIPTSDIKWETMVKTTRVQRRLLHYSEETLTIIPET